MQRLPDLDESKLTQAQRDVIAAAVSGLRGHMPGQMRGWLASPVMADRGQKLGEFLRYQTQLGPRLSELAILVTGRFWSSSYEWWAHARIARQAGLSDALIDAIMERREPPFADDGERVVYEVSTALHERHGMDDALFARATTLLGEQGLCELVGILGYYTLVSMTLNTYQIGVPAGEKDPFAAEK